MTPDKPLFYIARFVLEAKSSFALLTGLADGTFDNTLLRDANNLPALSGTSLAGVLRHRFAATHTDKDVTAVFGYADPEQKQDEASSFHLSWGCIHDSKNQPVEGLIDKEVITADGLLERLSQDHLIVRERVALNKRGVAKDKMKFDQTLAPKGCRFSVEMSYWSDKENDPMWSELLALVNHPLRLGSGTRNGYGLFKTQKLHQACFDLRNKDRYNDFSRLARSALNDLTLLEKEPEAKQSDYDIKLELEAEDFWRFGQTGSPLKSSDKAPDHVPLSEPIINWNDTANSKIKGTLSNSSRQIIVPATGVKGALVHRLEFHYRRLTANYATPENTIYEENEETRTKDHLIADLLGYAADTKNEKSQGQAGLLYFHDVFMPYQERDLAHLMHTSIDRFTGGVRDGYLFSEEMVWKKQWTLGIDVDWDRLALLQQEKGEDNPYPKLFEALQLSLNDLAQGRLALGAGASKGHGYFEATKTEYSENAQKWIQQWMGES